MRLLPEQEWTRSSGPRWCCTAATRARPRACAVARASSRTRARSGSSWRDAERERRRSRVDEAPAAITNAAAKATKTKTPAKTTGGGDDDGDQEDHSEDDGVAGVKEVRQLDDTTCTGTPRSGDAMWNGTRRSPSRILTSASACGRASPAQRMPGPFDSNRIGADRTRVRLVTPTNRRVPPRISATSWASSAHRCKPRSKSSSASSNHAAPKAEAGGAGG